MDKLSPGKVEKVSPGKVEKVSPGKGEKVSPGKVEKVSPGRVEKVIIIIIKTLFQEGNTISTELISLAALK